MATLDDRLLGEKLQYYCSSSEDENDDHHEEPTSTKARGPTKRSSSSTNTGPKGVIQDWQKFQEVQRNERIAKEIASSELMKKLSITCSSQQDEANAKYEEEALESLIDEKFMKSYFEKRMSEMMSSVKPKSNFGKLLHLESAAEFLNAIDSESTDVTVIIHIYEKCNAGCDAMNGCLHCLASQYSSVKFCKISASCAGLSKHFSMSGVPALLVYKNGNMIGNFVCLTNEFGEDFYAHEVECFLIENGILPNPSLVPEIIDSNDDDIDD